MENKNMIQTVTGSIIDADRAKGDGVSRAEDCDAGRQNIAADNNAIDFDSLLRAAEQGDANAQFILAELFYKMYEEGDGTEKDLEEAVKWYQASAGRGDARAQFEIGWCYHSGVGVEEAPEKAVEWYRLAAEQGYAKAQYWLGWCYLYGMGVGTDMIEAVKWYRLAAAQGYGDALEDLADLGADVSTLDVTA